MTKQPKKKNPNRLLRKIRTSVNRNIRNMLYDEPENILYPIPKKYLPAESYLRGLYNDAYFCLYAGLLFASLNTCCTIFERITRDFYVHFIPDGKSTKWGNMLGELKNTKKVKIENQTDFNMVLDDIDEVRTTIRNLLLHGKIDDYIQNTELLHNAIRLPDFKKCYVKLKYDERLHGTKKQDILQERLITDTHNMILFISIIIVKYNKYVNTKPLINNTYHGKTKKDIQIEREASK